MLSKKMFVKSDFVYFILRDETAYLAIIAYTLILLLLLYIYIIHFIYIYYLYYQYQIYLYLNYYCNFIFS